MSVAAAIVTAAVRVFRLAAAADPVVTPVGRVTAQVAAAAKVAVAAVSVNVVPDFVGTKVVCPHPVE